MSKIYTIMFFFSMALTLTAVVLFFIFGLNFGVDFKGGSILEVEFSGTRPEVADVSSALEGAFASYDFSINQAGEENMVIRTAEMTEETHQAVLTSLQNAYPDQVIQERSFDSIGPIIGKELESRSKTAIVVALLAIIIYIAFVFRKISAVLSSWAMSAAAMVALLHDVIIPIGVFSVLGHFYGVEISAVFLAALLTILGYSISDTVVIFDRVRENVIRNRMKDDFGKVVHMSVMQTLARSLNTTFTTLLSLVAIFIFGGDSLRYFSLAMIMGIFLGAYSSIFVASPLMVWWSGWTKSRR